MGLTIGSWEPRGQHQVLGRAKERTERCAQQDPDIEEGHWRVSNFSMMSMKMTLRSSSEKPIISIIVPTSVGSNCDFSPWNLLQDVAPSYLEISNHQPLSKAGMWAHIFAWGYAREKQKNDNNKIKNLNLPFKQSLRKTKNQNISQINILICSRWNSYHRRITQKI